jgi:hypothetical protein
MCEIQEEVKVSGLGDHKKWSCAYWDRETGAIAGLQFVIEHVKI